MNKKPVSDYSAWIENYTAQWTSFNFSNSHLPAKSALNILGHSNCPVATGLNQSRQIFQFLPLVNQNVYQVVVHLKPSPDSTLPPLIRSFLERLVFDGHGGVAGSAGEVSRTNTHEEQEPAPPQQVSSESETAREQLDRPSLKPWIPVLNQ